MKRKKVKKEAVELSENEENIDPEEKKRKLESHNKENQLRVNKNIFFLFFFGVSSCLFLLKKKIQSVNFWSLRDRLDKEMSTDGIRQLIELNDQSIVKGGRDEVSKYILHI